MERRQGFEEHPNESNRDILGGLVSLIYWFIVFVLIAGGIFFLALGLVGLNNSVTVAATGAFGSALFVGAIFLLVRSGFDGLNRRLDRQTALLEEQVRYLRFLAKESRKESLPQ